MPSAPDISPTPSGLWRRTKTIVGDALELPHAARAAFVEDSCAGDTQLRSEVLALLRSYETAGDALPESGVPALTLSEALAGPAVPEGAMIGRYRVGASLGTGGMGAVFEAFDTALQRPVAIKLLSMGLSSTAARRRFEAEASALARLDHPGVARVYEVGVQQSPGQPVSLPYFAMELVEGARTLDAFVRDANPALRALLAMFADICDAVHHGHQKGVLHRDIKPSNILVNAQGAPKVIDFGVARLADPSQSPTQAHSPSRATTLAGDLVGTPAYLPPEAFEQGMHAVDIRADVYALGVTLYELLARGPAFGQARLTPATARDIIRGKPPKLLGSLREDCKGDVETVVAKAMAREVIDRYQSVDQFAADLRRILAFEPVLARRASLPRQAFLFAKRNTLLVGVASLIALALVIGAGGLAIGLYHARASERKAAAEAARATQVSRFMTQMIRSASPLPPREPLPIDDASLSRWPSVARPGVAPTPGDLLAGAFQQLGASFPEDPALRADVALLLARSASELTDMRAPQLIDAAYRLTLEQHGPRDLRTIVALSQAFNSQAGFSRHGLLPEALDAVRLLNQRNDPADDAIVRPLMGVCFNVLMNEDRIDDAQAFLQARRAALEARGPADTPEKINVDVASLAARHRGENPPLAISELDALLARARSLPRTPLAQDAIEGALFRMVSFQRAAYDLDGAVSTTVSGIDLRVSRGLGADTGAYEWWSQLFRLALDAGHPALAELAAREQLAVAEAILGPNSTYTSKAMGRVARALLMNPGSPQRLLEAQRAAFAASRLDMTALDSFDGWAIYHETLAAWALRLRGEPAWALSVHHERREGERAAGITPVAWVTLIREAETAQCLMDLAAPLGMLPHEIADIIEAHLREAECSASIMGVSWPASELARRARIRFDQIPRASAPSPTPGPAPAPMPTR